MKPIEAQIGDINVILVPYPQSEINQIIQKYKNNAKINNQDALLILPEQMYHELCLFEYQKRYFGNHYDSDDDQDDDDDDQDVKNAEELTDNDSDQNINANDDNDELLNKIIASGIYPDYIIKQLKMYKSQKQTGLLQQSEFVDMKLPQNEPHNNLIKPYYTVNISIYGVIESQLLTTTPSLLNILEYHRNIDDNDDIKTLKKIIERMVCDYNNLMRIDNLLSIKHSRRFCELFNKQILLEQLKDEKQKRTFSNQQNSDILDKNGKIYPELLKIRRELYLKSIKSLQIPIITEPYLSRRIVAIPDHTGRVPSGKVFIQIQIPSSSPRPCSRCCEQVKAFGDICEHCQKINTNYYPIQNEITIIETNALNPLSLKRIDAVYDDKLAELFPNQDILIFSTKNTKESMVSLLSKTRDSKDKSYLNQFGKAKTFDVIIPPLYLYDYNDRVHITLEHRMGSQARIHRYLSDFKTAFYPSANIFEDRSGFDRTISFPQPQDNDDDDYDYDDDINDDNYFNCITEWIYKPPILNLNDYISYFLEYNKYNYQYDLLHSFEIESQVNSGGMKSCRTKMILYQELCGSIRVNYAPQIYCHKMYNKYFELFDKYPLYMINKKYTYRKHVHSISQYTFDKIITLPDDLLKDKLFLKLCNIDHQTSMIIDPSRDYVVDVMDPQENIWIEAEYEKSIKQKECRYCNYRYKGWRDQKHHLETPDHRKRMEEIQGRKRNNTVKDYIKKYGLVINNNNNNNNINDDMGMNNNNINRNNNDNNNMNDMGMNNNNRNPNVASFPNNDNNNNRNHNVNMNVNQQNNIQQNHSMYSVNHNNNNEEDLSMMREANKLIDTLDKKCSKPFAEEDDILFLKQVIKWLNQLDKLTKKIPKNQYNDWWKSINQWREFLASVKTKFKYQIKEKRKLQKT